MLLYITNISVLSISQLIIMNFLFFWREVFKLCFFIDKPTIIKKFYTLKGILKIKNIFQIIATSMRTKYFSWVGVFLNNQSPYLDKFHNVNLKSIIETYYFLYPLCTKVSFIFAKEKVPFLEIIFVNSFKRPYFL